MIERIHSSHLGIEGCLRRAREILYWPSMNAEVKEFIESCEVCRTYETKQRKETLRSHDIPDRPWSKVGTDLFTFNGMDYVLTVDYYSGFFEIDRLDDTTSGAVIHKLKAHFSRYGIPDQVISDNAKQYVSTEFENFSKKWKFEHITSSPKYPQSNGKAESAVKIAKNLMCKAKEAKKDPYLAILDYRNTPTQDMDTSPAQRLMQRRTKTLLPTKETLLKPQLNTNVAKQQEHKQQKQAHYYNKGAKELSQLKPGDVVRVQPDKYKKNWQKAVVRKIVAPRSYEIRTEAGVTLRRNRRHLRYSKEGFQPSEPEPPDDFDIPSTSNSKSASNKFTSSRAVTSRSSSQPVSTRSGRISKQPRYLKDFVTN